MASKKKKRKQRRPKRTFTRASCSPSARNNAPTPLFPAPAAARTTRIFSSGVHRFRVGVFCLVDMAATFACRSHFDNVGCPTPHSLDRRLALIADGPIIFWTIAFLNRSLCCTASSAFSPPIGQLKRGDNFPDTGGYNGVSRIYLSDNYRRLSVRQHACTSRPVWRHAPLELRNVDSETLSPCSSGRFS